MKNNAKPASLPDRIMSYMVRHGKTSRKEIATALGVTPAAISGGTAQLLAENKIVEVGERGNRQVGRNCVMLDVNPTAAYVVGFDLSITSILVTVLNVKAIVVASQMIPLEQNDSDAVTQSIAWLLAQCDQIGKHAILGMAILATGQVPLESLQLNLMTMLRENLLRIFGIEPIVMNNIRGLALSETYFEGKSTDFVLIKYGPGVGGAIVHDGKILSGHHNQAGEIGHMLWDPTDDNVCAVCHKRGCLESLVHYHRIIQKADPAGSYHNRNTDDVLQASVNDQYQTLYHAMDQLIQASSMLMDFVDPATVFLAGELFTKPVVLDYLEQQLQATLPEHQRQRICLVQNYKEKRFRAAGAVVLSHHFGNETG